MKKAYIISTGTELILGTTIDTNASFISQQLGLIGIKVVGISVVGDSKQHIKDALELGLKSADIVITSGGLGPTKDDLTKEMACEVMKVNLQLNEREAEKLKEYFKSRRREMPESNLKQAMFPKEAQILANPLGTAPGMYLNQEPKVLILLPGPPKEMKKMLNDEVKPRLINDFNLDHDLCAKRTIKVFGPGESQVEEIIASVMENPHGCSIALIAQEGEIQVKVTAEGQDLSDSEKILEQIVDEIKQKLTRNIYGYDDDKLSAVVAGLLIKNNYSVALAESCTGGLMSKYITDEAGSSEFYWGSVISYSNEAKVKLLGVSEATLELHGAVSEATAEEMASGIKRVAGADLGLAITGIAGPAGGSDEKPVGLVYIGLAHRNGVLVKELRLGGERAAIRTLAAKAGLDMIRRFLQKEDNL